MLALDGF